MERKLKWPYFKLIFEADNVGKKSFTLMGYNTIFQVYSKLLTWSWVFQKFEIYSDFLGVWTQW